MLVSLITSSLRVYRRLKRGVEQGGKSPFSLLSEPISSSSLLFEPISPSSLNVSFSFSPSSLLFPPISPSSQLYLGHFFLLPILFLPPLWTCNFYVHDRPNWDLGNLVPRVSLLCLPWSKKDPGCSWSRAKLWHKLFHRGRVNQQFLSISTEAKERSSFEIFQSCCKLHTGQMKYTNLHITSISAGRRPVCLLLEVKLFRCFMLPELTKLKAHCSLNKTMFY